MRMYHRACCDRVCCTSQIALKSTALARTLAEIVHNDSLILIETLVHGPGQIALTTARSIAHDFHDSFQLQFLILQ